MFEIDLMNDQRKREEYDVTPYDEGYFYAFSQSGFMLCYLEQQSESWLHGFLDGIAKRCETSLEVKPVETTQQTVQYTEF